MRFRDIPFDLLPGGTEPWEVDAADRMLAGEHLGPKAKRSALRLIKRFEAQRRDMHDPEVLEMREEFYRQQFREARRRVGRPGGAALLRACAPRWPGPHRVRGRRWRAFPL